MALSIHEKLFDIAKKFYRDFNENYDGYKGVPNFKPIELDTTDDEIEQVKTILVSGVNFLCTVHGNSIEEVEKRMGNEKILRLFDRFIELERNGNNIYGFIRNSKGILIGKEEIK